MAEPRPFTWSNLWNGESLNVREATNNMITVKRQMFNSKKKHVEIICIVGLWHITDRAGTHFPRSYSLSWSGQAQHTIGLTQPIEIELQSSGLMRETATH